MLNLEGGVKMPIPLPGLQQTGPPGNAEPIQTQKAEMIHRQIISESAYCPAARQEAKRLLLGLVEVSHGNA